jgi:hypothetical protein
MGILRLRSRHIRLARSSACLNPNLRHLDRAAEMLTHYEDAIAARGMVIVPKSSRLPWWVKLTTTFRRSVRTGDGYEDLDTQRRALILAHEFVHVLQWRKYLSFGPRYLGARFGWAMEVQAYRESMRARKVLRFSYESRARYARDMPDRLWDGYPLLRQIRRKDLRRWTRELLREEL